MAGPDDSHPPIAAHYAERMKERAPEAPDRNLALELVRVTEAAAMTAARWVGRGDKNGADGAAVNAMRTLVSSVSMDGVVVIGELVTGVVDPVALLGRFGVHVGSAVITVGAVQCGP